THQGTSNQPPNSRVRWLICLLAGAFPVAQRTPSPVRYCSQTLPALKRGRDSTKKESLPRFSAGRDGERSEPGRRCPDRWPLLVPPPANQRCSSDRQSRHRCRLRNNPTGDRHLKRLAHLAGLKPVGDAVRQAVAVVVHRVATCSDSHGE